MAFVDMGYQRLYRNKVKEGNSLKTDDITGAKPRRAVRDRDPLAFDKMNDLKATNGNLGMDDGMQVRPGAKNLDHYQRMIRNLPGGAEKWEGAYAMQMKNGDGVRGLMKYKEPNRYDVEITPKPGAFLRSPHHRDERSSPSAFNDFFQNNMGGVIPKSTKIAGERSLDASNSEFSKPFGRPGIEGIESEKLPTLPHPTRFRSPQVTRGRNENMNAIMSHMSQTDNSSLFPGGRKGRGDFRPVVNDQRGSAKNVFDAKYNIMQEELEYKKEKGLLYRRSSPDNPLQMAAGRRLNKSVDQSSRQKYQDVDYVKNIFDKSEPSSYKYQNNDLFNGVSGGTNAKSKGMFLSRKQDKRQGEQGEGTKARDGVRVDAQFLKNADLFF